MKSWRTLWSWLALLLILVPVPAQHPARDARYPAHWWTPVVDPSKPGWEILPQEAGPGEVILSKRNELGLLSNFAPTPFVFHEKRYASLEGFWQMMKYPEGADDPRAKFSGDRMEVHARSGRLRWSASKPSARATWAKST